MMQVTTLDMSYYIQLRLRYNNSRDNPANTSAQLLRPQPKSLLASNLLFEGRKKMCIQDEIYVSSHRPTTSALVDVLHKLKGF